MTVPKFGELMLPILQALADDEPMHWRDLRDSCARQFQLTDEDLAERMATGEPKLDNRVRWANNELYQAGLIDRPARGMVRVTADGLRLLDRPPETITREYLAGNYASFREFEARGRRTRRRAAEDDVTDADGYTPIEIMAAAEAEADAALRVELLERVRRQPSRFLEQLVVRLLEAMGYSHPDRTGEVTGGPGDGGIDGIIHRDPLSVDRIYLQAKRYADNPVGPAEVREFVGALRGVHADRGVFITTTRFTEAATEYLRRAQNNVITIDGERLVDLMLKHHVGVQPEQTFVIRKIDEDFFE